MQKFCVICGAKLGQNNRFCPECGKPVAIDAPENIDPEIVPETTVTPAPAVAPCQKKWIKVTIAALLLLGGLGVGGYFIFDHFSNKQTSTEATEEKKETTPFSVAEQQKNDREYQKATELLKNADLSNPTLEMTKAAALTANIEILETIKKNGFSRWDDPEIILFAAEYGSVALIEKLVSYGADINAKDRFDGTVLHYAAQGNNVDIIRYFIKKNIDVNSKGYHNTTALHVAALRNNFEAVKCLVENGADINAAQSDGETPLIKAVQAKCRGRKKRGNLEMVKYLVEKGADLTLTDHGYTVLDFARKRSTQDIVDYLISQGAKSGKR